jgi:hypothetical protein
MPLLPISHAAALQGVAMETRRGVHIRALFLVSLQFLIAVRLLEVEAGHMEPPYKFKPMEGGAARRDKMLLAKYSTEVCETI